MKKRVAMIMAIVLFVSIIPITAIPADAATADNVMVTVPWDKINRCGHQTFSGPCQAYCWAYCRIILDNKDHTYRDYWVDGVGGVAPVAAGYNDYTRSASQIEMLKIVYDNINMGRPVMVQVQGSPGNVHFVVAIGYRGGANREGLTPRDILILNPSNSAINVTAGSNETYTYLDSCTLLTGYACWTAKYGGTEVKNIPSNGNAASSAPAPSAQPQSPTVTSTVNGSWTVTIPANYKLLLYSSETAANSATYVSARVDSYRVGCSKKTVLSNGTIRYYGAFNANDHYWLTYTSGMTVTDDESVAKIHTINFNANGGSVSPSSKQVAAGGTYGELPIPTRSGYTFDGWYTAANGGTQVTSATALNLPGYQITIYAHWTNDSSTNYIIETGLWDITIPANCPVTYYAGPGSMVVSHYEPGQSSAYRNVNFNTRAILSDGTIRFEYTEDKWFVLTSAMSVEDRMNPPTNAVRYVNCYSQITCAPGTVNLYKNPGDTTRYDYFSNGQSTRSSVYAFMSDGSKWYQVHVISNGTNMDLWLRSDSSISVTTLHTYGAVQYETAHPHKGYQICECGQKAYTETNIKVDSCLDCDKVRVTLDLGTIGPKVPAESITVTNGHRYLYVYKPTGEVIKQVGGDVYEVHMTPGSTYQLNTVAAPSNTTDRIQYSVRILNNIPSNGGGVSVSKTGLISANDTAHGDVIVEITCGNCKTEFFIVMCTPTGELLC